MFFFTVSDEPQSDSKIKIRFCRKCETVNEVESRVCKKCGAALASPVWAYPIGTTLREKYQIEKMLGIGGMGVVYQAKHLLLQRPVALKCIHPHIIAEDGVLARFQREAITASSVEHPNVLRVIDLDITADKTPILVTELLVGRDLERCIQERERFSTERIIDLLSQTLDGLDAAHQKGVLHRDIKPQNLFLLENNAQEQIKIVDFGLAKLLEQDKNAPPLTQGGFAMGTPAYMSPEQVRGEPLDPRADLWSVGVILHQLMTYRLPFMADSAMSTALSVLKDEIGGTFNPGNEAQRELWALCKRALNKDREGRPESAKAFRDELQQIAARAKAYQSTPAELAFIPESAQTPEPVAVPQEQEPNTPLKPFLIAILGGAISIAVFLAFLFVMNDSPQTEPINAPSKVNQPTKPHTPTEPTSTSQPTSEPTPPVSQPAPMSKPSKIAKQDPKIQPRLNPPKTEPGVTVTVPAGQNKFTYAKSLVLSGNSKDAAKLLEEVIKEEPNNASAHRWLGDAYHNTGKTSQAKNQWREFLRLAPSHPDAEKVQSQINAL